MAEFCTSCGTELAGDSRFCQQCGTPVGSESGAETPMEGGRRTIAVPRRMAWWLLGILVLIGGGVAAYATWGSQLIGSGESGFLLQEPRPGDRSTLLVAEPGMELRDAQVVADDVVFAYSIRIHTDEGGSPYVARRMVSTPEGLAVAYRDSEARNHIVLVSGEEISEIFESPHPLTISYVPWSQSFVVVEETETAVRCHVTDTSGEAEWSVLADRCVVSDAGAHLAFSEGDIASNSTQIGRYTVSDNEEIDLGQVPGELNLLAVGQDGVVSVTTLNVSEFDPDARGSALFASDGTRIYEEACVGFFGMRLLDSGSAAVWCISTDGVGALEIVNAEGDVSSVLEEEARNLQVVEDDGEVWVVIASGSGDRLVRIDPDTGDPEEMLRQDAITLRSTDEMFLSFSNVIDDPNITVSVFDPAAEEMRDLGVVEGVPSLYQYGDDSYVSVEVFEDTQTYSWYQVDIDAGELVPIVLDWTYAWPQNQSSDQTMLLVGRQLAGDDETLVAVGSDGELMRLDESPAIQTPFLVGEHVVYSTSDESDFSRPEVRRIAIGGDSESELLWEDVSLVAVPWTFAD